MKCFNCEKEHDGTAANILPVEQRTKEVWMSKEPSCPLVLMKPEQLCGDCIGEMDDYLNGRRYWDDRGDN